MPEQVFSKDKIVIGGQTQIEPGPSAFHDTPRPFLARILDIPYDVISSLNLEMTVKEIDGFILSLITERKWKDDNQSYADILGELEINLNIHRNTDCLELINRLSEGTRLLKLQKMHKRREADIQKQINNIQK